MYFECDHIIKAIYGAKIISIFIKSVDFRYDKNVY